MSEMVERVMGVLDAHLDFLIEAGHLRLDARADFSLEEMTRAAIGAMREPTDAMVLAGRQPHPDRDPADIWPDMIDEALK